MDFLTGMVVILAGAAMVKFVVSPATARGIDAFAAGFLPYRSYGWPRGVQEEEPVAWKWSARDRSEPRDLGPEPVLSAPELVDISGDEAPAATAVDPGSTVRGMARRRP